MTSAQPRTDRKPSGEQSDSLLGRLPPQSLEAEAAVLGCMLLDSDSTGLVIERLKEDDFYSIENQLIFKVLCELFDANRPVDHLILRDELSNRGFLERIKGTEYLVSLSETVPSAANAQYYAEIVRQKAIQRALISTSTGILRDAYDNSSRPAELLDKAERMIFEIAERQTRGEAIDLADIIKEAFDRIEEFHDRKARLTGLATGFSDLDDITSGLQDSELIILAARPSMGKSTLALNIIGNVGIETEKPVVLFTLEMSKQQVAQNMLCSNARVDAHRLRRGLLEKEQWQFLATAAGRLSDAPIFIDDTPSLGILELKAKARRLKARHDIALVVIDYLQLMDAPKMDNRQQEISEISRGLKALARELNVPVLALCQLNRGVEMREGHKPRMSDLRESGALEQDADVVLLLHREEYYGETPENKNKADIIVAKQRNGPTGFVPLQFQSNVLRFHTAARKPTGEPF